MKIGDLVRWACPKGTIFKNIRCEILRNTVGIIIGFDEDNDPAVLWQSDGIVGQYGEYRLQIEVIDEDR